MEIVLRAAAIYFFLWLVTKAMGRRELSQMSPFELILLVTMGDLIQQAVTQDDRSVVGGVLAVSTLAVIIIGMSYATFKSATARDVLEGTAVIVVRDGKPLPGALRTERLALEEVKNAAREQGVEDLALVRVGILEADGKFSFLVDGGPSLQQQTDSQQSGELS